VSEIVDLAANEAHLFYMIHRISAHVGGAFIACGEQTEEFVSSRARTCRIVQRLGEVVRQCLQLKLTILR
jgi:hypothetical protein